ncbi:MAG: TonB-dependent receptor plug domain-containing protein [Thermodesulfobacteriota bacterium]|nr:TonB-dependent receptor plug domain-containing protein [Thermodesulfobacteriota bacterium]
MRYLKLLVIGLSVIYLFCCHEAFAQTEDEECPDCPPKERERVKLDDVFVHAFHGGAVTITPTKTIVDIEKFGKSGSVERVEDILMHLTGIDLMRGSTGADPQSVIMMRGFDDSRFTIAIDGRPITAPTAGADTYVDWSSLTTGDIEKIEVIRGGASALYENSQGGVINIITRKGTKRETLVPKITLRSGYTRFETYLERIAVDGGTGDLTYFGNFGYKESEGYLRNNDWRGRDYSARLSYSFPFQGNVTLSYKASELDLGYPVVNDPNRADYDSDYPKVYEDADSLRKYRNLSYPGGNSEKNKETNHLDLIFEQPIGDGTFTFQLFQTRGEEDSWSYEMNSDGDLVQKYSGGEDREEQQQGGRLQYHFDLWKDNSLTIGYDHRRMEVASTKDIYRIQAGYFEDIWAITHNLSLSLGLRYIHVREYSYPFADASSTEKYRHLIYTKELLPKSTLHYRVSPETEFYISANRDYRVPGC